MYPCQCWEENNYKWSQGFRCWYPTWWFRLCKDPWVSAHPLSPTWSRAYNTLWSWRCSKKRMSYRIKWCSAVFICFPNVLNCMFHFLCVCVCVCVLSFPRSSQEKRPTMVLTTSCNSSTAMVSRLRRGAKAYSPTRAHFSTSLPDSPRLSALINNLLLIL